MEGTSTEWTCAWVWVGLVLQGDNRLWRGLLLNGRVRGCGLVWYCREIIGCGGDFY